MRNASVFSIIIFTSIDAYAVNTACLLLKRGQNEPNQCLYCRFNLFCQITRWALSSMTLTPTPNLYGVVVYT